jgi:hypothetical protein
LFPHFEDGPDHVIPPVVSNQVKPDPHYNPNGPEIFDGSHHLFTPQFEGGIKNHFKGSFKQVGIG